MVRLEKNRCVNIFNNVQNAPFYVIVHSSKIDGVVKSSNIESLQWLSQEISQIHARVRWNSDSTC